MGAPPGKPRAPGGGRKQKPTAIKLLEGNLGRRPMNELEPKPRVLEAYPAPEWLGEDAKKIWNMLAPEMAVIGLLTTIDLTTMARYCEAWQRWKEARDFLKQHGEAYPVQEVVRTPITDPKTGEYLRDPDGTVVHEPRARTVGYKQWPQSRIFLQMHELMMRIECEFGMTPAARTRIQVMLNNPGGAGPQDPFDYD